MPMSGTQPRRAKPKPRRQANAAEGTHPFGLPVDTPPMEAQTAAALPTGPGWQFEPKWDGFRCLAFKAGAAVELRAKSGKPLGRYFPEVVAMLADLAAERFVLDGELVIEIGGQVAFDALQLRLHPAASRVQKLARETPARFVVFDMLLDARGTRVMALPLTERRAALESFLRTEGSATDRLALSSCTRARATAQRWLDDLRHGTDGVVAKRLDAPYTPGERTMIKVKQLRSADCVVGGFRYAANSRLVGSLLLGLYDASGKLHHVGFTATLKDSDRPALTRMLEKLRAPPGFTGSAPGGPSRWSSERSTEWEPLRPELVAEVRYDHVSGGRFRHGTRFLRWRPDKTPRQCTCEQIARGAAPGKS
jgi:ATP-dependent DNA ligase